MKQLFSVHKRRRLFYFFLILAATAGFWVSASSGENSGHFAQSFLWIAVILLAARLSSLVEKWGQPSVLGELVVGLILGNLVLFGWHWFEPIKQDGLIAFLAELGVVLLLFQIGLESNISQMKKVGLRAFIVACIGVVAPFVLGTWVVGPWLAPGLSFNAYLFIGATLTATSVGITARVFKDLGKLQLPAAQIVLGAAVIDDVLGLIILAVVSAIVTIGAVSFGAISLIVAKSVLFLVGAIVVGHFSAPYLGKWLSKVSPGQAMKLTLALVFCLVAAFLAQFIGLAPIIGAFAAGLVLDAVHFKHFEDQALLADMKKVAVDSEGDGKQKILSALRRHEHRQIEDIIEPIGYFLVPIFFVVTGMSVKLSSLTNGPILLVALGITVAAFVGKVVAGLGADKGNRLLVGFGMIPRGEVGLIFAMMGKSLGVINDDLFSAIVIMVIVTTLLTPPILTFLLKKK